MTVFDRVKLLAKQRGKSLNRIEEELGLPKNVLYRMKNSDNPTKDRLETLANYFDVSVDYLLGRTENPNTVENENANISPEFFAIQRKSKKLSQKEQQKLLKLMELTFEEIDNGDFEEDDDDDL